MQAITSLMKETIFFEKQELTVTTRRFWISNTLFMFKNTISEVVTRIREHINFSYCPSSAYNLNSEHTLFIFLILGMTKYYK